MSTIRLLNIDCVSYLQRPGELFDLIIADPPYSSGGMVRGDRMLDTRTKYLNSDSGNQDRLVNFLGDTRDQRAYLRWSWLWMSSAYERCQEGGLFAVFSDWRQLPTTTDAVQAAGFVWRGIVPWWKPSARPQPNRYTSACEYLIWATKGARSFDTEGARYAEGFYRHQPPQQRIHVTEKPVELYRHLYKLLPNRARILDPFLGSAASAIAAEEEGRDLQFTGLELSKDIHRMATERLRAFRTQLSLFQ